MTKKDFDMVAKAIQSQVAKFSDERLDNGDDVWLERELAFRDGVVATANAIRSEIVPTHVQFDVARFAAACGLYVSNGHDNYSDCHPGELTWEVPIPH